MAADTKQKSFRLPPEEWEALARVVEAGHADNETAALRWLLARVPELMAADGGREPAGAELLAAKDAHIASLERQLARADGQQERIARLLDQAQQLAAMSQQRLPEPKPAKGKTRKRK